MDQIKFERIDTSRDHHMGMCSTHGKQLQDRWRVSWSTKKAKCEMYCYFESTGGAITIIVYHLHKLLHAVASQSLVWSSLIP